MIKHFIKYYRWIIFSTLLQIICLSYINFIYLKTPMADPELEPEPYKLVYQNSNFNEVNIPSGAKMVGISYDNTYVLYIMNGKIFIKGMYDESYSKIIGSDDSFINYATWIKEKNVLIYASVNNSTSSASVTIKTYDVENDKYSDNYSPITIYCKVNSILSIEVSPYTNSTYILIKKEGGSNELYSFNTMNQSIRLDSLDNNEQIKILTSENVLLIEDSFKKIKYWDGVTEKLSNFATKYTYRILNIDNNDRIYLGLLDEKDMIYSVITGTIEEINNLNFYKKFNFGETIDLDNIIVSCDGKIYINKDNKWFNYELPKKTYTINGQIIKIEDDLCIAVKNNKLYYTPLN